MPSSQTIDALSGSDESAPEQGPAPRIKKRKRGDPAPVDFKSEGALRMLLGKQRPCKKKTCLQQFSAPEIFGKLTQYRGHWFDLEKMDQDNFAT